MIQETRGQPSILDLHRPEMVCPSHIIVEQEGSTPVQGHRKFRALAEAYTWTAKPQSRQRRKRSLLVWDRRVPVVTTTVSLCTMPKGSLQEKATSSDTGLTQVLATRTTLPCGKDKRSNPVHVSVCTVREQSMVTINLVVPCLFLPKMSQNHISSILEQHGDVC